LMMIGGVNDWCGMMAHWWW